MNRKEKRGKMKINEENMVSGARERKKRRSKERSVEGADSQEFGEKKASERDYKE